MDGFMFGFQPPSEEEQEQMRQAHERHQMAWEEFKHSSQRLFEELDVDQLRTLQTMLNILVGQTQAPLAALWEGIASATLKHKFNICITCGVNHDEEMPGPEEPAAEPPKAPSEQKGPVDEDALRRFMEGERPQLPPPSHGRGPAWEDPPSKTADEPLPGFYGSLSDEDRANMRLYHLDDVYDEDTMQLLHFKCTGVPGWGRECGMTYPSIEDRMRKGPDECSGCFMRSAQG